MIQQTNAEIQTARLHSLLAASAAGDQIAFSQFYDLTRRKLFGIAISILKRPDLAEEVLQEAYVKIWHHVGSYDPARSSPVTWTVTIVRNHALDVVRRKDISFRELLHRTLARIDLRKNSLRLSLLDPDQEDADGMGPSRARIVDLPWSYEPAKSPSPNPDSEAGPDPQLVNAIVRAHAWIKLLNDGIFDTIEDLAEAVKLNPNVLRQNIRLAFMDPRITDAIIEGRLTNLSVTDLAQCDEIAWRDQTAALLGS